MPSTVDIGTTRTGVTELTRHWAAADPWAAAVIVHGIAEHSGRYERTGQLMADAGIDTRSFDLQGFGALRVGIGRLSIGGRRSTIRRSTIWRQGSTAGLPTILMGHSLGGLVVATYRLSLHRQPNLVVLSSPALDANVPAWQRSAAPILSRILPKLSLPNPVKGEQLSRDPAVGKAYFSDPLVHTKTTTKLGAVTFEQMALIGRSHDAYDARTLIFHGSEDSIVPARFSESLADRPSVDRVVYPDLQHETLNEPEGPEIVADVIDWIRKEIDPV